MEKKMKIMASCHQVKNVFHKAWDQHGQVVGGKVKMRMKNWSRRNMDNVCGIGVLNCEIVGVIQENIGEKNRNSVYRLTQESFAEIGIREWGSG